MKESLISLSPAGAFASFHVYLIIDLFTVFCDYAYKTNNNLHYLASHLSQVSSGAQSQQYGLSAFQQASSDSGSPYLQLTHFLSSCASKAIVAPFRLFQAIDFNKLRVSNRLNDKLRYPVSFMYRVWRFT